MHHSLQNELAYFRLKLEKKWNLPFNIYQHLNTWPVNRGHISLVLPNVQWKSKWNRRRQYGLWWDEKLGEGKTVWAGHERCHVNLDELRGLNWGAWFQLCICALLLPLCNSVQNMSVVEHSYLTYAKHNNLWLHTVNRWLPMVVDARIMLVQTC